MTTKKILEIAAGEIGTKEVPSGSNNVKYNTEYYGGAVSGADYPWCCAFIWWLFKKAGASELFYGGQKTAYCPTAMNWYKSQGRFYKSGFQPGDIVFFDFSGSGIAGHIGIIEKTNSDGSYTTIEGNTSVTSNDNGGAVMRRTRYKNQILGAGRPDYKNEEEDMEKINELEKRMTKLETTYNYVDELPDWAKEPITKLFCGGVLRGDGEKLMLSSDAVRVLSVLVRILEKNGISI